MNIEYKASPNKSPRNGTAISMLVLHATVGSYDSSLTWLRNPASKVSSHYLIRKDGHITQLLVDDLAAWHAGRSTWRGLTSAEIQECSLGIELENDNDGIDPYPAGQLFSCRELCMAKITAYSIPRLNVVRHLDIAIPPKRKTDPAPPAFPWPQFADSLYAPLPRPPLPNPMRYQVVAIQISERQIGGPPYAGELEIGEYVEIDMIYANQMCHLHDGRGFVPISALVPAGG